MVCKISELFGPRTRVGNFLVIFFIIYLGFEKPSAIQQRAIKPIVKGRDVIAQAQSGTGKTATFSVSLLQSIDTTVRETQVLCLSPTRELAVQIQKVVLALGDYMNVQCHACIGGTNLGEDIRKLDYGQHVVSGISNERNFYLILFSGNRLRFFIRLNFKISEI